MNNSKKNGVDTNYEPSKKPSKLFDDCKDINVNKLYNVLEVQLKHGKKHATQAKFNKQEGKAGRLTQGRNTPNTQKPVWQTQQGITMQPLQLKAGPYLKEVSYDHLRQNVSIHTGKINSVRGPEGENLHHQAQIDFKNSGHVSKKMFQTEQGGAKKSKRSLTNPDHRFHLARPYQQPVTQSHNPHIQSISELEARIIGDERQHRYLQYALNNPKARMQRVQSNLKNKSEGQPNKDGTSYNIVVQNQNSKVFINTSQAYMNQMASRNRDLNNTAVHEDFPMAGGAGRNQMSRVQTQKNQILSFDNITMRQDVALNNNYKMAGGRSQAVLQSVRRDETNQKSNADLQQIDVSHEPEPMKKTKSGRSIVILKNQSSMPKQEGQISLNSKIKIFQNSKSAITTETVKESQRGSKHEKVGEDIDDSIQENSVSDENKMKQCELTDKRPIQKVTTLVLDSATVKKVNHDQSSKGVGIFKLNQNDEGTIPQDQDQSPDVLPQGIIDTAQHELKILPDKSITKFEVMETMRLNTNESLEDTPKKRPEDVKREIVQIDRRHRYLSSTNIGKPKMTFNNLISEFVKAPAKSTSTAAEQEKAKTEMTQPNQRKRFLRNVKFIQSQQNSKSILKDPDYKYKYACKDLAAFKKKKLTQDGILQIIRESYQPLDKISPIKGKVDEAIDYQKRKIWIRRSYNSHNFNLFGPSTGNDISLQGFSMQNNQQSFADKVEKEDHHMSGMSNKSMKRGVKSERSTSNQRLKSPQQQHSNKMLLLKDWHQDIGAHINIATKAKMYKQVSRRNSKVKIQNNAFLYHSFDVQAPNEQQEMENQGLLGGQDQSNKFDRQTQLSVNENQNAKNEAKIITQRTHTSEQTEQTDNQISQHFQNISLKKFSEEKWGCVITEEEEQLHDSKVSAMPRRECEKIAAKTAQNFFKDLQSDEVKIINEQDKMARSQGGHKSAGRLMKKVQSQDVGRSMPRSMIKGYYSPVSSIQEDNKQVSFDISTTLKNPTRENSKLGTSPRSSIFQGVTVSYRNFNDRRGLGILYQNKNQDLRIGDLHGVVGEKAKNIPRKGLFENANKSNFNLTSSHIEIFSKKQLELISNHYKRVQKRYTKGAVQYRNSREYDLSAIADQIPKKPAEHNNVATPTQRFPLHKLNEDSSLGGNHLTVQGSVAQTQQANSPMHLYKKLDINEEKQKLISIRNMRNRNNLVTQRISHKQSRSDNFSVRQSAPVAPFEKMNADSCNLANAADSSNLATQPNEPEKHSSSVNNPKTQEEPQGSAKKSTIDKISMQNIEDVIQGSGDAADYPSTPRELQSTNKGNSDIAALLNKEIQPRINDIDDKQEQHILASARFVEGGKSDREQQEGQGQSVFAEKDSKLPEKEAEADEEEENEWTRQEPGYEYWNKQQQVFEALLEEENYSVFRDRIQSNRQDVVIAQQYALFNKDEEGREQESPYFAKSRRFGSQDQLSVEKVAGGQGEKTKKEKLIGLSQTSYCGFKIPKFDIALDEKRKKKVMMQNNPRRPKLSSTKKILSEWLLDASNKLPNTAGKNSGENLPKFQKVVDNDVSQKGAAPKNRSSQNSKNAAYQVVNLPTSGQVSELKQPSDQTSTQYFSSQRISQNFIGGKILFSKRRRGQKLKDSVIVVKDGKKLVESDRLSDKKPQSLKDFQTGTVSRGDHTERQSSNSHRKSVYNVLSKNDVMANSRPSNELAKNRPSNVSELNQQPATHKIVAKTTKGADQPGNAADTLNPLAAPIVEQVDTQTTEENQRTAQSKLDHSPIELIAICNYKLED